MKANKESIIFIITSHLPREKSHQGESRKKKEREIKEREKEKERKKEKKKERNVLKKRK